MSLRQTRVRPRATTTRMAIFPFPLRNGHPLAFDGLVAEWWAKARIARRLRVGKIVRAPCPRGDCTSDDFAYPTESIRADPVKEEAKARDPQHGWHYGFPTLSIECM